jgi:hypothetical protein
MAQQGIVRHLPGGRLVRSAQTQDQMENRSWPAAAQVSALGRHLLEYSGFGRIALAWLVLGGPSSLPADGPLPTRTRRSSDG